MSQNNVTFKHMQIYAFVLKRIQAFQAESLSAVSAGITAIVFKHQFINNLQKRF